MAGQNVRCVQCDNILNKWEKHLLQMSKELKDAEFINIPLNLLVKTLPYLPNDLQKEVGEWIRTA